MNDCTGLFGRLFGHSFEARHNSEPAEPVSKLLGNFSEIPGALLVKLLAANERQAYLCDICTRCGSKEPHSA